MTHDAFSLAGQRVWARRRGRARSLLLAIGATVFVLALCLSVTAGLVANSSLTGVRDALAGSDSSDVLRAAQAGDGRAQDAGVRAAIAKAFDGAPVRVRRTVSSGESPLVRWTITPIAAQTSVADLARLRTGYANVDADVTKSRAAHSSGAVLTGRGAATVLTLLRTVGALDAIEPIPITVLSLAGIVALLLARSLLTDYRQNETRFLRSRGGSGGAITALDARESLVICLLGSVLGWAVAQVVLVSIVGPPTGVVALVVPPIVVLALSLGVNVLLSGLAARAASGVPRPESGRRRAAAPLTLTGFGIAITLIALWRFDQNGSDGATFASDPSAVLAPGALLCAGTLLCLLAAGQIAAGIERGYRSGRSIGLFPIRSVNRHLAILVGPTALLAIALAIAAVTGAYTGTWQRFSTDAARLTTGGDLRASLPRAPILSGASDLMPLASFTTVPGVRSAAIAARQADEFGDVAVSVIAVSPRELPRVVSPDSTVSNPHRLASELGSSTPVGLALPGGASGVTITVAATGKTEGGDADRVSTTLWLGDRLGNLFPLQLRSVPVAPAGSTGSRLTGSLPAAGGPWVLEAVDAGIAASSRVSGFSYALTAVSATVSGSVHAVSTSGSAGWAARDAVFDNGTSGAGASGTIGFTRATIVGDSIGNVTVRVMPSGDSAVPVVLSRPFAATTGLVVGSKVAVDGQWASFGGVVKAIVPGVPGATSGSSMLASLPALDRGWLAASEQVPVANEVWLSSTESKRVASTLASRIPSATVTVAASADNAEILGSATTALWIGAAGTSAFAIIALIAVAVALLRRRATETFALRAMGVDAGRQASLRQRELGFVALVALIIGVVVGAGVSLLVAATMARLSTPAAPSALPLVLRFDPVLFGIVFGVLVVAFGVCAIVYGLRIRRQAGDRS